MMKRRDPLPIVAAALLTVGVAGCGANRTEAGTGPPEEYTGLRVENDNISSMRIWVVRVPLGGKYSLGTARGTAVTMFKIPRTLLTGVNEVTFEISPQGGGRSVFTRTITISPGDEILLRIPSS